MPSNTGRQVLRVMASNNCMEWDALFATPFGLRYNCAPHARRWAIPGRIAHNGHKGSCTDCQFRVQRVFGGRVAGVAGNSERLETNSWLSNLQLPDYIR